MAKINAKTPTPCQCGGAFVPPTDLGTHSIYGSKPHSGIARIVLKCNRRCGRTMTIENG